MDKLTLLLIANAVGIGAVKAPLLLPVLDQELTVDVLPPFVKPGPPTALHYTKNVIELKRESGKSLSATYVQTIRQQAMAAAGLTSRLSVRDLWLLACLC